MAYHIKTDGTITEVHPKGTYFTGEEISSFVAVSERYSSFELIGLRGGHVTLNATEDMHGREGVILAGTQVAILFGVDGLWINEEGKYAGPGGGPLDINEIATAIYIQHVPYASDAIVGDVLITSEGEVE